MFQWLRLSSTSRSSSHCNLRRANGDNPKARWLKRTDERLVAAFDAYDEAVG
jgi:hypothetical protein